MSVRSFFLIVSIGCSAATALSAAFAKTEPKSVVHQSLKGPSEFDSIGDQAERSRAMFAEIGKLLTHPRCMSCHRRGRSPAPGRRPSRAHAASLAQRRWKPRHPLRRVPHRQQCHVARGRHLSEHSRPSTLGPRATVDGLGRQNYR